MQFTVAIETAAVKYLHLLTIEKCFQINAINTVMNSFWKDIFWNYISGLQKTNKEKLPLVLYYNVLMPGFPISFKSKLESCLID